MISFGMECAAGGQATKNRGPDFDLMKLSPSCPKSLYEIGASWFNVTTRIRYGGCRIGCQWKYLEESVNIRFPLVCAATLNLGELVRLVPRDLGHCLEGVRLFQNEVKYWPDLLCFSHIEQIPISGQIVRG